MTSTRKTDKAAVSDGDKDVEIERIILAWLSGGMERGTRTVMDLCGKTVGSVTVRGA